MKKLLLLFTILLILPVTFADTQSDLWDSAISVWHFNEGDGVATDYKSGHNGSVVGSPTNTTAKLGSGAMNFDGSNDWFRIANDADFAFGTGNVSMQTWFKTSATTSNDQIISSNWASGTAAGLDMNNGQMRGLYLTGSGTTISVSPSTYADGQWHHMVAVIDRDLGLNLLYVDGVNVDNATAPGSLTTSVDYAIGEGIGTGNNPRNLKWNGDLDEVVIFSTALDQTDVDWLYNGGTGREVGPVTTNPPIVNIVYPVDSTTYSFQNISQLNFTLSGGTADNCWYSIDGGANTSTSCTANITGLNASVGTNVWTVYANNSDGIGSATTNFTMNPAFFELLQVWRNSSTGLNVSWVDIMGNWFMYGDVTIMGDLMAESIFADVVEANIMRASEMFADSIFATDINSTNINSETINSDTVDVSDNITMGGYTITQTNSSFVITLQ